MKWQPFSTKVLQLTWSDVLNKISLAKWQVFIVSGGWACLELFQGSTPVTISVYISKSCVEECLDSHAYANSCIAILYLFNFLSTLISTKRDRIKVCRLLGNMRRRGGANPSCEMEGNLPVRHPPWGECWHLSVLSSQSILFFFDICRR